MVVCNNCGSEEVQEKSWTKPNNDNEYIDSAEEDEGYCEDCGDCQRLEDKDDWDNRNRCSHCLEINNEDVMNCECHICTGCGENDDAGECDCDKCDNCDISVTECCCDRCEDCHNVDSQCVCEDDEKKDEEVSAAPTTNNTMVTFKCLDCDHKFEALPTMTMCDNCLSDNIIQHGNNNP